MLLMASRLVSHGFLAALFAMTWVITAQPVAAAGRKAFVVGNSTYVHAKSLPNPANDARDLAGTAAQFLGRVQERSGVSTRCDIRIGDRLPIVMEREVWQIIREAILNAERHARATHLLVTGRCTGPTVYWTVRDDGVGIDTTRPRADSYGMVGMRERAERLDADFSVRSLPGGGTEVRIELATPGAEG